MTKPFHRTIVAASLFAAGCIGSGSVLAATAAGDNTETMTVPAATASAKQGSDYGNPADAKKVAPSREQVQQEAHRPSSAVLDDNAQRQHDPDSAVNRDANPTAGTTRNGQMVDRQGGAATSGGDTTPTPSSSDTTSAPGSSTSGSMSSRDNAATSGSASMQGSSDGTISQRDWNKIDTNGDNLISPDEMSAWLQKRRPAEGSSPQQK